jgi:hypothetical protein
LFLAMIAGCSSSTETRTSQNGGSGSGSGSSSGSSTGVTGCGLSSTNPTCDLCLQSSCCTQAAACAADPACGDLMDCITLAPFTDGGVAQCTATATTSAESEYQNFETCMTNLCASSCNACHGVPQGCGGHIDQASCTQASCLWQGTCSGVSYDCYGLGEYECTSQQGCYYEYSSMQCTGVAEGCYAISGQYTCEAQSGCTWDGQCTGTAPPCDVISDETSCLSAGCSWD